MLMQIRTSHPANWKHQYTDWPAPVDEALRTSTGISRCFQETFFSDVTPKCYQKFIAMELYAKEYYFSHLTGQTYCYAFNSCQSLVDR